MIRKIKTGAGCVEYTLVCARNRTSLLLQALPEGKIKLYAPAGYSMRAADRLVKEHLAEIGRAHARMKSASDVTPGTLLYEGSRRRIAISEAGAARINLDGDTLWVRTPFENEKDIHAQIKR